MMFYFMFFPRRRKPGDPTPPSFSAQATATAVFMAGVVLIPAFWFAVRSVLVG